MKKLPVHDPLDPMHKIEQYIVRAILLALLIHGAAKLVLSLWADF